MKKQQEQKKRHEIYQFEDNCHLWNIVSGKGNGIAILRSIVDSILNNNFSTQYKILPSILLIGEKGVGKTFVARALANSLAIRDIRECPGKYFENGYSSHQFFDTSATDTVHIITDIQQLNEKAEANLWKYLKNRECTYYNSANRAYTNTVFCNGMIILTAINKDKISDSILKAATHVIKLEPLNDDQLEAVIHQVLSVFCGVDYDKQVINAILYHGSSQIEYVLRFIEHCLMIMNAVMADNCLTMELVNKASKLRPMTVPPSSLDECIPF